MFVIAVVYIVSTINCILLLINRYIYAPLHHF